MISDSDFGNDQMEFAVDEDQVNLFGEEKKLKGTGWDRLPRNYDEDEETGPNVGATLITVVEKIIKTTLSEKNK